MPCSGCCQRTRASALRYGRFHPPGPGRASRNWFCRRPLAGQLPAWRGGSRPAACPGRKSAGCCAPRLSARYIAISACLRISFHVGALPVQWRDADAGRAMVFVPHQVMGCARVRAQHFAQHTGRACGLWWVGAQVLQHHHELDLRRRATVSSSRTWLLRRRAVNSVSSMSPTSMPARVVQGLGLSRFYKQRTETPFPCGCCWPAPAAGGLPAGGGWATRSGHRKSQVAGFSAALRPEMPMSMQNIWACPGTRM